MTGDLARQQQALLQALWLGRHEEADDHLRRQGCLASASPEGPWQRGLRAYRSNGIELAQRALAGAYPVVAQLLGEDNFAALAGALWRRHPPERGDVAQWGGELAALIDGLPDLQGEEPYLADVARVEWALHRAATAADAEPDPASFSLLTDTDPRALTLTTVPGLACIASAWPVVTIINAHLDGEPALEEAGRQLRAAVAQDALVWRQGLKPQVREATPGESRFLQSLNDRRSLADSLASAPELDFNGWLAPAVQSGLITGVVLLASNTPGENS